MILIFFVLFIIIGFLLGFYPNKSLGAIILTITIVWTFIYGAWGLATLIELIVGSALGRIAYYKARKDKYGF